MYFTGGRYYSSVLALYADMPQVELPEPQDQADFDSELVELATLLYYPWQMHGRQAPEWLSYRWQSPYSFEWRSRKLNRRRNEVFATSFAHYLAERYVHYHALSAGLSFDEFVEEWREFAHPQRVTAKKYSSWESGRRIEPVRNGFGDYMIARRWTDATPKELLSADTRHMSLRHVYGPLRRAGWSHRSALQLAELDPREVRTAKRLRLRGIAVRDIQRLASQRSLHDVFLLLRIGGVRRNEALEVVGRYPDHQLQAKYRNARKDGLSHIEGIQRIGQ